jgi:hypothetical protein
MNNSNKNTYVKRVTTSTATHTYGENNTAEFGQTDISFLYKEDFDSTGYVYIGDDVDLRFNDKFKGEKVEIWIDEEAYRNNTSEYRAQMLFTKMDELRLIENIVDSFDFSLVHKVLEYINDHVWNGSATGVKSEYELQKDARILLKQVAMGNFNEASQHGLVARKTVNKDGHFSLKLSFCIAEASVHW